MRRKEREITDTGKINEIISACHCCRLGLRDGDAVYIVPMSFGFTEDGGSYTFYFHSAKEGRKIGLMIENPQVGFELDANYQLSGGVLACDYTAYYQSVIGRGAITFLHEPEEKIQALRAIMRQNTGREEWEFQKNLLEAVCIFKLEVRELSCKENRA